MVHFLSCAWSLIGFEKGLQGMMEKLLLFSFSGRKTPFSGRRAFSLSFLEVWRDLRGATRSY